MHNGIIETLIWASMVAVVALAGLVLAYRTARHLVAAQNALREETLAEARLDLEERQHDLTLRQETLPEAVAAKKAELEAQAAKYRTDREAAGMVVEDAAEALRVEMKALAEARAEAAPDRARKEAEGIDWGMAQQMYSDYLDNYRYSEPLPFGQWVQGWDCCGAK